MTNVGLLRRHHFFDISFRLQLHDTRNFTLDSLQIGNQETEGFPLFVVAISFGVGDIQFGRKFEMSLKALGILRGGIIIAIIVILGTLDISHTRECVSFIRKMSAKIEPYHYGYFLFIEFELNRIWKL